MRRRSAIAALLAFTSALLVVAVSPAAAGGISLMHRSVSWTGGPLTGSDLDPAGCGNACDDFALRIDVPASYWRTHDGGVVVRIAWKNENDEIDLHVYDARGIDVAISQEPHTNVEQALIYAPPPGTYRVHLETLHAVNTTYSGTARVVSMGYRDAPTAATTMRFAPASFVDPQVWASEPSVWAAPDGSVYATAIWGLTQGSSMVWRSDDGARTFRLKPSALAPGAPDPRMRPCNAALGGGDADVIADRTGRLYFADLWAVSAVIGVSTDRGNTWSCNPVATSSPEIDRPWLAPSPTADGTGPNVDAYMAYRDLIVGALVPYAGNAVKPYRVHVDVTRDGGKTWTNASTYAADRVGFQGPIFTAADGTVYQVFQYEQSIWLARSTNQGKTFTLHRVSNRFGTPANYWPAGDVDAAGNVYLAWVDQGSWDTIFTRSTDHGVHWSRPQRLNPPASETATFPWVAAGKRGDVAVSWYGTGGTSAPDYASPRARWYAWVARTADGTDTAPAFQRAMLSPAPVRFGPLCTQGIGCAERQLGDFFEIEIARDGSLVATFNDDARIQKTSNGSPPSPYVMAVRQISGLGMARSAGAAVEPSGDAQPPDDPSASDVAAMDLVTLPQYRSLRGGFRLGLKLRSATDLTQPLQGMIPSATDAYWLALWRTADRVEYAGLHVDRQGRQTFFGGDAPVSVARLDPQSSTGMIDKLASYPATFNLRGRVDVRTGTISIDVPFALYHLKAGDSLYSVQGFSMTALGSRRTFLLPTAVIDATPPESLRIT